MWRTDGQGELYTYLPPSFEANKAVCNVAPFSTCNDVFGASVGRGSFNFAPGTRTTIGQRVKLNDVGTANGEIELFVEGKSIFTVTGLELVNAAEGRIRGLQMQSFFGGELPICSFALLYVGPCADLCACRLGQLLGHPEGPGYIPRRFLCCYHQEVLRDCCHHYSSAL